MDQAIWQKIAKGERGAFTEMYVYFFKKLFNYGRKFTDKEMLIEDTLQEVFVVIWDGRRKLTTIQSPQSYLFFVFRNALFRRLKEEQKRNEKETNQKYEPEFTVEAIMIKSEADESLRQELYKELAKLPARQREAIFLRFYEELPYEQIAEVMQISLKATYKTVSKGLILLRHKLHIPMSVLTLLLTNAQH